MMDQKYHLQNRWVKKDKYLLYYGMRVKPNLFVNKIKLTKNQSVLIDRLPNILDLAEEKLLSNLIKQQVIVSEDKLRVTPTNMDEATFCKRCVANDFMIPGLEFNEEGLCPMCESMDETKDLKGIMPVRKSIEINRKGRFDIAVFYTGGKDSSYLLYYLAKQLKLRVLAFTWDMPFLTDNAKASIENAKKHLPNVEFISRKVSDKDLHDIYSYVYPLELNPCICPAVAYALFYPEMVNENIPYFVLGNEPVQMLGLYFNHIAPKIAYDMKYHKWLNGLLSIPRVLTLRKPLRFGQMHTLMTMRQIAYGDIWIKKWSNYNNELVTHASDSLRNNGEIIKPLRRAIRRSNWTGNIPRLIHIDFNDIFEGGYSWTKTKNILKKEMGWVEPPAGDKALHTSCSIETCKDYTQFIRFYRMETQMMPFSALEISLASSRRNYTKEQAMNEVKKHLGFSLEEVSSCKLVKEYLKRTSE